MSLQSFPLLIPNYFTLTQIPLPIKAEIKIKSSPDLESPKSPDGKLGIEVSDDGKIAHIAQVDKVVLAVKFAKGGIGLQVLLYKRKISCFFYH